MSLKDQVIKYLTDHPDGVLAKDIAKDLDAFKSDINSVLYRLEGDLFERVPNSNKWILNNAIKDKGNFPAGMAASRIKSNAKNVITGRDILNILNSNTDGLTVTQISSCLDASETVVKSILRNRLKNVCDYDPGTDLWTAKPLTLNAESQNGKSKRKKEAAVAPNEYDLQHRRKKEDSIPLRAPLTENEEEAKRWIIRYPQTIVFFKNGPNYLTYFENAIVLARVDARCRFRGKDRYITVSAALYPLIVDMIKKYHVNSMVVENDKIVEHRKYEYDNAYISFASNSTKSSKEIKASIKKRQTKINNSGNKTELTRKELETIKLAIWNDEHI